MYYLRLIGKFAKASTQNELAYSANFWISLLHSLLNLGTGVLGIVVLFSQMETIHGWDLPATPSVFQKGGASLSRGHERDGLL